MSAATSPGTGLAYGLRRVCAAWGMARSSFYAMTSGQHAEQPPAKRRGPKPAISDQALLVAIEADLEASPWEGEGYRKVWARLRVCRDIRVARKRVLRLMRENNLLSPHRCRRRGATVRSSLMPRTSCGAGVRVFTVDDGSGWIFAVEHWNAECGLASASADRFAALQPIGACGLMLDRGRRGSGAGLADGSAPSLCRTTSPTRSSRSSSTPSCRARPTAWSGSSHARIIHGRIYSNIAELRDGPRLRRTLQCPVDRRKERLSPAQARQAWHAAISIRPAA